MGQAKMLIKYTLTFFKSVYRNRLAFFFMMLFPLMFVGIFGIAFQTSDPTNTPIAIGIINYDKGIPAGVIAFNFEGNTTVNGTYYSQKYIELLSQLKYTNTSTNIFKITIFSPDQNSKAENLLEKRDIKALVILDENFSLGLLSSFRRIFQYNATISFATNNWKGYPPTTFQTKVIIKGDRTLQQFSIASSIISDYTLSFFSLGESKKFGSKVIIQGNYDSKGLTVFDYIVPGLIIFATLQTLSSIAVNSLHDVESGILERVKLTRIKQATYVSALILNQVIISLIQLPIMFLTAIIFGFPMTWNLVPAFMIALFLSLGVTGIGFMIAGTVKNADAAVGFANMISVPMAFLSSSFFTVPNPIIIPSNKFLKGNELRIFDILPSTPAVRLMRTTLLGGASIIQNWYDFTLLFILSIVYLIAGLYLYSKKHLSPE